MSEHHRADWVEGMMGAISRCAPVVVGALARHYRSLPTSDDPSTYAGQLILRVAEAAYAEDWGVREFQRRAEAKTMECIGSEPEDSVIPRASLVLPETTPPPRLRAEVMKALSHLDSVKLQVLALILQEGLSIAETAMVLDLPEWRVHQECAEAVGQIRRRVLS